MDRGGRAFARALRFASVTSWIRSHRLLQSRRKAPNDHHRRSNPCLGRKNYVAGKLDELTIQNGKCEQPHPSLNAASVLGAFRSQITEIISDGRIYEIRAPQQAAELAGRINSVRRRMAMSAQIDQSVR